MSQTQLLKDKPAAWINKDSRVNVQKNKRNEVKSRTCRPKTAAHFETMDILMNLELWTNKPPSFKSIMRNVSV